jgi:hypothetical protein
MRAKRVRLCIVLVLAAMTIVLLRIPPEPTVLVVDIDMSYDEVVRRSTYPARAHGMPPTGETGFATIDVIEPSVIIRYVDPRHGFALPPTKFAALTFGHSLLETVSTSPMLEARRFPEAVEVLAQVQARFKAGGWVPWSENQSVWFDLSPTGQRALHAELMRYTQSEQWLDVPKRNLRSLLRIKCVEDCDDADDALYLVDVGLGKKSWYAWDGE